MVFKTVGSGILIKIRGIQSAELIIYSYTRCH
ncbi:hypothetical protein A2U01_0091477 [Trifolium medium]|uniref:Uncharacterized protein n=1 Tax=Trifolium medium TaxID=97028 RepID=A0A392UBZ6_9FABA|nr:hypothetical protein [Trifolium medium]